MLKHKEYVIDSKTLDPFTGDNNSDVGSLACRNVVQIVVLLIFKIFV